jgi:hypothetical protein
MQDKEGSMLMVKSDKKTEGDMTESAVYSRIGKTAGFLNPRV